MTKKKTFVNFTNNWQIMLDDFVKYNKIYVQLFQDADIKISLVV